MVGSLRSERRTTQIYSSLNESLGDLQQLLIGYRWLVSHARWGSRSVSFSKYPFSGLDISLEVCLSYSGVSHLSPKASRSRQVLVILVAGTRDLLSCTIASVSMNVKIASKLMGELSKMAVNSQSRARVCNSSESRLETVILDSTIRLSRRRFLDNYR